MTLIRRLFVLISLLFITTLSANEEIHSYHSDISVQQNGDIHVIETIQVQAENKQIRRGIYRDFPTIYKDQLGAVTRVGFKILSVKRDGVAEPFHTKNVSNGIRIYIGSSNIILTPGSYQYQIEYQTDRQIGFFDDYDELYWNVTGNGWNFPILMASANVTLPQQTNSPQIQLTGYTGRSGSKDQFLTHHPIDSQNFYFETTQPLNKREGLTIAINWPKGIVHEPNAEQKRAHFIEDNKHSLIAVTAVFSLLIFYFLVWLKVGKDPDKGVIHPLYQAPDGFSPASTRLISKMSYDNSCFTAAIVNMTINGLISIDKDSSDDFIISKLKHKPSKLAAGEAVILQELFKSSEQITLTKSEHSRISKAIREHEVSLREDYEKQHFMTNKKYFVPGILLSIAAIIYAITKIPDEEILISTIFIGIFSLIPFMVIGLSFRRYLKKRKTMSFIKMIVQIASLGIFFFIASDIITAMLEQLTSASWPIVISLYLLIAINVLFEQWLKAPTLAGRKLLDKIEGFKLYLEVAEEDELKLSGQPEFNSDIYQAFLPYAIALGVDHAWSQKLERAIASGTVQPDFHPTGFHHHNSYHGFTGFSDSLSGSLDSAISSSSVAPGSSSGSSGGGSSGGGGGGGGGGGW